MTLEKITILLSGICIGRAIKDGIVPILNGIAARAALFSDSNNRRYIADDPCSRMHICYTDGTEQMIVDVAILQCACLPELVSRFQLVYCHRWSSLPWMSERSRRAWCSFLSRLNMASCNDLCWTISKRAGAAMTECPGRCFDSA